MIAIQTLSAAIIAAGCIVASQTASAFGAGDIFVRGGIARTEITSENGTLDVAGELDVSDERGLTYAVGYLFHDSIGIELSGQEKVEHDLSASIGPLGGVNRMPLNLMVNYYPLGGVDSRVQPYLGAGLNYTHFSGEDFDGLEVQRSYGAVGQLGIDLAVTRHIMLNGFANYADVEADVNLEASGGLGTAKIDPLTIGGGVTYRF